MAQLPRCSHGAPVGGVSLCWDCSAVVRHNCAPPSALLTVDARVQSGVRHNGDAQVRQADSGWFSAGPEGPGAGTRSAGRAADMDASVAASRRRRRHGGVERRRGSDRVEWTEIERCQSGRLPGLRQRQEDRQRAGQQPSQSHHSAQGKTVRSVLGKRSVSNRRLHFFAVICS